jgi:peptide/nickel transport system ATP-binding protein
MMTENNIRKKALLTVGNLVIDYEIGRRSKIHAVSDVSFKILNGETLGLVGESGCGKSTLARAIVQLLRPTSGEIWLDGKELTRCSSKQLRTLRPRLQMIFQDATASLNPGRKVGLTISEPLRTFSNVTRQDRIRRVHALMEEVGLNPAQIYDRRPFELSIGQCQRISIARALITNPSLLVCDEPVSSLDVSIQAQILNLLESMKARYELAMLFISHDLAVVKNICDRVAVMYLGILCEIADSDSLYRAPRHPYTAALLESIPKIQREQPHKRLKLRSFEIPSPASPPSGCRFHTRCPRVQTICSSIKPFLKKISPTHSVACHNMLDTDPNIS